MNFPASPADDVVEELHGVKVPDPYRWLEETGSPRTRAWIEAQNRFARTWFDAAPSRRRIIERLTRLWKIPSYGIPWKRGGRYFYTANDGLRDQAVLYTLGSPDEEPRVLLDPNLFSADGTIAAMAYTVSEDGRHLAYEVSSGGSDWKEIRIREIATGQDLEDRLRWVKFSGLAWDPGGTGLYYNRYDEPEAASALVSANYFPKLCHHRLGTPQAEDRIVYERPDHPDWGFHAEVTEDGRTLIILVWKGTEQKNLVFYRDLTAPESPIRELITDFEAGFYLAGSEGSTLWLWTDLDAPRGRVIAVDLRAPERARWREIIPERDETLTSVSVVGEFLFAQYLANAHSLIRTHRLDGTYLRTVGLPGIGSAAGFHGRRRDDETFFAFSGFTSPDVIYRHEIVSGRSVVFRQPKLEFNPLDFETVQVFYASRDGTTIPMFLSHRRGLRRDGNNPTWLSGYGGFRISKTPAFSPAEMAWMEMGGVYAVPNLRGGGEFGEEWHEAGIREHKQNVFDDFIAAAEWLIANRYTSRTRLAIGGRSNGGLLVGACLVQRPELFGAVVAGVGVLDMLRFHKFTIGWAWTADYGSPDDPVMFPVLKAYSPLHNVRPGTSYPPTLMQTGDHDDRVVPAHSFKFAAALQAAQAGPAPILIRIETRAGHGPGKPTRMLIEEAADRIAFLARNLGMEG